MKFLYCAPASRPSEGAPRSQVGLGDALVRVGTVRTPLSAKGSWACRRAQDLLLLFAGNAPWQLSFGP
jgi:hypothetical protein